MQAGAGLYLDLYSEADTKISSGLSTTLMAYQKNLSNMTYGNGGYFSPQSFFALSVPLNLVGTNGRLGYQLQTNLGLQRFRQNDAPYFPSNQSLQASATAAAAAANLLASSNINSATFAGSIRTALAYRFGGVLEYQLGPQLKLGGSLAIDNGRDYRELKAGFYMRLALDAVSSVKVSVPLAARSPYAVDNLWRSSSEVN